MKKEISQDFCKKIIKKLKNKKLTHPIYVIHEHQAKRAGKHFDLRLEINKGKGLESWALRKQPSKQHSIKRLAVQTTLHDLNYAAFQGIIPEGNAGAGTVKIWDKGTFNLINKKPKKIIVNIKGKKLKGKYCLINFKEKNWLFFRKKD
ncbi:3'-phosphoesterase [Candidatus Woesearchaeota archaeon]|nr:3'-phosphoesterase [Candidatus Woesearchaeota archaeon]